MFLSSPEGKSVRRPAGRSFRFRGRREGKARHMTTKKRENSSLKPACVLCYNSAYSDGSERSVLFDEQTMLKGALMAAGGGICWGISGTMGQYLFTHEAMHTTWLIPIRLSPGGPASVCVLAGEGPASCSLRRGGSAAAP